jgi:hypothetical protein
MIEGVPGLAYDKLDIGRVITSRRIAESTRRLSTPPRATLLERTAVLEVRPALPFIGIVLTIGVERLPVPLPTTCLCFRVKKPAQAAAIPALGGMTRGTLRDLQTRRSG